MSYARVLQSQGAMQIKTESGNLDLAPAGSLTLKGHVIGTDIMAYNADLQTIADLGPGVSDDNKVVYWDNDNSAFALKVDASNSYSAAADGALTETSGAFSVNVDDSTVEISSNSLQVKDGAVSTAKLAADAVTNAKIASNAVDTAELVDGAVTVPKLDLSAGLPASTETNEESVVVSSGSSSCKLRHGCVHHQSTSATPVSVALFSTADQTSYMVEVVANARNSVNGATSCYRAHCAVKRLANAATLEVLGSTNVDVVHEDESGNAFNLSANTTSGNVEMDLTGPAANCDWSVSYRVTECA